jgi:hypothetical protein
MPARAPSFEPVHVIACATVFEELQPFLPAQATYEVLEFGLHQRPPNLRAALQARLDAVQANTVLLGYGLCSLAVAGLRPGAARLVIPRVDDCIALYLGSRARYLEQVRREPGTYYLTKGWVESADTPFKEYDRIAAKHGKETADEVIHMMFQHYTRLCFINTGAGDLARYHAYARQMAERFKLRFETMDGAPDLVRKLAQGPWDDEFVVVPPGGTLEYAAFVQPLER